MRLDRSERLPRAKVLPGEKPEDYDLRHRTALEERLQAISDDVGHFAGSPMYIDDGEELPDATAELAGLVYHKRVEGQEDARWECYQDAAGTWGWRRLDNDELEGRLGDAAYMDQGAGNGLDSDTVDGRHAQQIEDDAVARCPAVNTRCQVYLVGPTESPPIVGPPQPIIWDASDFEDVPGMWGPILNPERLVVPAGMNRVRGACQATLNKAAQQNTEFAIAMHINGAVAHGLPASAFSIAQGQNSDAVGSIMSPWVNCNPGDYVTFVWIALQILTPVSDECWAQIECASV